MIRPCPPASHHAPPRCPSPAFARIIIAILTLLLAPTSAALALQDTPPVDSDRRGIASITRSERDIANGRPGIAAIQFGWNGEMPNERWGPVRVWIDGGRTGFSGALILSFRQDASQTVNIITPASGTPGRTLPVEALALLPRGLNILEVSLISDRGRIISSERFSRGGTTSPTGAPSQNLATFVDPTPGLVLIVQGTRTEPGAPTTIIEPRTLPAPGTFNAAPQKLSEPERIQERWGELRAATISAEDLSTAWSAYDGVEILIVRDRDIDDANPLAIAAIHEWLLRGGRMVVLVQRPNDAYRRWLPSVPDADAATLGELAQFATPAAFTDDLKRQRVRFTERQASTRAEQDQIEVPEISWTISNTLRARPITISPRGLKRGWRIAIPASSDPAADSAATPTNGLAASGPVGFGFVTIVTFDPQDVSAAKSTAAAPAAWRRVLVDAAEPWLAGTPRQDVNTWGGFVVLPSGATPSERAAISRASNRAVESLDVGDLSTLAFVGLAAIMLALTLLMGPIDALVLKRLRARHRAWLTALGWITIACIIAGFAPSILRGGESSRLSRFEIIDVLQESSADPVIARGPNPTLAFAAAITALFSGPSGRTSLEGTDDAAWWRGISSRTSFGGVTNSSALAPLQSQQRSFTRDGIVLRGSPIRDAVQGQWMLRTLADASPPPFVPRVELRGPENSKTISIIGLPDNATIGRSALVLGSRRLFLKWEPHAPGDTVRRATAENELEPAEWAFWEFTAPPPDVGWWAPPEVTGQMSAADMLNLPGAAARRWSIDSRLARGDYAVLLLEVTGVAPQVRIQDAPAKASIGNLTFRIIVPIND